MHLAISIFIKTLSKRFAKQQTVQNKRYDVSGLIKIDKSVKYAVYHPPVLRSTSI